MKLVSMGDGLVVICFHFSIFEPLETAEICKARPKNGCDLLSF